MLRQVSHQTWVAHCLKEIIAMGDESQWEVLDAMIGSRDQEDQKLFQDAFWVVYPDMEKGKSK